MSVWYTRRTYTHKKLTDFSWFMRAVAGLGLGLGMALALGLGLNWSPIADQRDLTGCSQSAVRLASWRSVLVSFVLCFCLARALTHYAFGLERRQRSLWMIAPYDLSYTFKLSQKQNVFTPIPANFFSSSIVYLLTPLHRQVLINQTHAQIESQTESQSQPQCKRCVSVSQPVSSRALIRLFSGKPTPQPAGSLQIVESWPCKHLGVFGSGTFHCVFVSLARILLQTAEASSFSIVCSCRSCLPLCPLSIDQASWV